MKKTTKRALSFLLTLVMLASTMSVGFFGITAGAAGYEEEYYYSSGTKFLTDIAIGARDYKALTGGRENDAKGYLTGQGYTLLGKDLNDGKNSAFIHMGYKMSTDESKAIRAVALYNGGDKPSSLTYNINGHNCTFYPVLNTYYNSSTNSNSAFDLNTKAGGDYIFMYYTRDPNAGPPITAFDYDENSTNDSGNASQIPVVWLNTNSKGTAGKTADFNAGAGGDYIYVFYAQQNSTSVDTSALRTAVDSALSKNSANYTSDTYSKLTTAYNTGNAIVSDYDTYGLSGSYDQTAINNATTALNNAISGLKTTVYLNPNGGSLNGSTANASTTIQIGGASSYNFSVAGYTPTRTGYTFKGWAASTAATSGSTSTVNVGFNQTLYAIWEANKYSVVFDNLIDFSKWNTSGEQFSNVTSGGFTLINTNAEGGGELTSSSPFFPVTPGKQYKVDIDFTGDNWDVYIFFCDANGTWVDFADGPSNRFSANGSTGIDPDNAVFTAPNKAEVVKAQIRVDTNVAGDSVTFENIRVYEVGTVEDGVSYEASKTVTYDSTIGTLPTPTRAGYEFLGWYKADGSQLKDTDTVNVADNLYVTSQWKKSGYTITWNVNGETVTSIAAPGETPVYPNGTPTKASTAEYTYTFTGWSPAIEVASGDKTYTAQFEAKKRSYTITWEIDGKTETTSVEYGETPTHSVPTKESTAEFSYEFTGWTPAVVAVTGNATYKATFKSNTREYWVSWVDHDGSVIKEAEKVAYGTTPTAPADPVRNSSEQYDYTFAGWSPKVDKITGDTTYTATYTESLRSYTITWVIDGNTETTTVKYGDVPTHADPTKAETDAYTYEFTGWDTTPVAVTGEATYTAQFKATKKSYTITWVIDGVSETTSVEYGEMPTHADPTKAETDEFTYKFTGWTPALAAVTGAATYTAQFEPVKKSYKITFVNHNDEVLYSADVEYGATPEYKGEEPTKAGNAQYSYVFTGWSPEIKAVTGTATYKAQFEESTNVYTVTWENYDGSHLETDENVPYGTTPKYNGATPTKPSTDKHEYVFENVWTPAVDEVTGDVTYTAQFTEKVRKYTVSWKNSDGTLIYNEEVEYGETPAYAGATPTKAATDKYTYTFKDWGEIVPVTGNVSYIAQFTSTVNKYTITWMNGDTVLKTEKVAYDEMPEYDGTTPSKAADAQYTYTFSGWTPEVVTVTGDATYTAKYDTTLKTYTVTWLNENGAVLETDTEVPYGTPPSYDGATPAKDATEEFTYTFDTWTPAIVSVTGNATYTATYKSDKRSYAITWEIDGETETTTVEYGKMPTHADPTKAETDEYTYKFTGWTPTLEEVTGEATYKANFEAIKRSYTITWKNDDGSVIDTTTVEYGVTPSHSDATKENTAEYTYTFAGWTPEVVAVKGNAEYTATYTAQKNSYKITWLNDDGSLIDTTTVEYGETPTHADATKAATAEYTYTFKGWTPAVVSVTGDATYTATYTAQKNSYTITWLNEDGTEIDTTSVEYGEVPTHAAPTKENTAEYTYTFAGWTPDVAAVTGTATYKAVFTATKNKYTVTWVDEDGSVIRTDSNVEYGTAITAPANPTKEADAKYTYTFAGWSPAVSSTVTGDVTYTATYAGTLRSYAIKWEVNNEVVKTDVVEYGQTPEYTGAEPTKAATAQYTYKFKGWTPAIEAVTGEKTYVAEFESIVNEYTITFVNYNGTELQSTKVPYGTMPEYNGNTPVKTAEGYTYTFNGWTPELAEVTGDKTYTAVFTESVNVYTITWVGHNNTFTTEVAYGATVVAPAVPVKEGFIGVWEKYPATMPATNLTVNADYVEDGITVNWVIETDSTVTHQTAVRRGQTITPDSAWAKDVLTVSTVYTFKGWSETKGGAIVTTFPTVTAADSGSKTYYAVFETSARKYTITWKNDDGSVIDTTEVAYGTVPTHADATKAADDQYTYTFDKWSPELVAVTGEATYTATYTSDVNYYTVTWIVEGQTAKIENVAYGTVPSFGSEPTKAATAQYTYTFAGWSPVVSAVTGNATYTATFNSTVNKYTVTWVDENGTVLETDTGVEYGTKPSFDKAEPTKAATAQYTYTFAGWDGLADDTTVTGDVTFKATYTSTVNKYTVKFVNEDGTVLQTEELAYGATPVYGGAEPTKTATAQYTFTFAGWDNAIAEVTGNATYKATYTSTVNNYTVTWVIDGEETTETYAYGATPSHEDPDKEGNAQYSYKFTGWEPAIETVKGNATYTAKFSESVNTYTVTWIIDGKAETQTYAYGAKPEHADPVKAADAQYTYTFAGWDKEITTVTGNVTYTAKFSETVNEYTVTWSIDGTTETETYAYGAMPEHADPVKAADAQYTYTFAGWDKKITTVTGNVTYTATFNKTTNKYTITWKNGDTVLKTEQVEYNKTPSYVGDTPVKTGDAQYSYVFSGWTPTVVAVTGDATYTAAFTPVTNKYTVTWVVEGKVVETDENVEYGATPKYDGAVPTKQGDAQYSYTFADWDPTVSNVEGNVTYTAKFTQTVNKYTVKFVNEDGTVLYSAEFEYGATPEYNGETPTKAATDQYTYTFDKWSPAIATVEGTATYTATYTSTVNKYTVEFVDEDGTVLQTEELAYGATPVYGGAEPTKTATAQYTFTFAGWDNAIAEVTGNATYKATYTSTVNKYAITWIVNGVSTTEQVAYGTVPAFNGSTDKAPTEATVYTFAGWDNEPVQVTGAATYTATYTESDRLYTISWVVNGETTTEQYKYNATPSFKGSTDIPETPAATYVFKGWDKEIAAVTGDATYTAEYDVTLRGFVITWIVDGAEITDVVEYGKVPVFTGSTDKDPTATETFTFAGWDKTPVAATEDTTYTATYTSSPRKYTVSWKVDGVVVKTAEVAYNSTIPTQALPAEKEGYTVKWDNTITKMPASPVTIEAIYTPKVYPVYWIVDGTIVYSASVPFGTAIPEKAVPTKEGHSGKWVGVPETMPIGGASIYAEYSPIKYTVMWRIDNVQNTDTAIYGTEYVLVLENINLPEDVRITVGGAILSEEYYNYDSYTGTITIAAAAVKGNINIIEKTVGSVVNVINTIYGGTSTNKSDTTALRQAYHTTIVADKGYKLPSEIAIYVDGLYVARGYTYDAKTGRLTINAEVVVGEIEIYVECVQEVINNDPDRVEDSGECNCNCHSANAFLKFFFNIANFLRKLFGMTQYKYCACGDAHW